MRTAACSSTLILASSELTSAASLEGLPIGGVAGGWRGSMGLATGGSATMRGAAGGAGSTVIPCALVVATGRICTLSAVKISGIVARIANAHSAMIATPMA
jgi:hypothetical protein